MFYAGVDPGGGVGWSGGVVLGGGPGGSEPLNFIKREKVLRAREWAAFYYLTVMRIPPFRNPVSALLCVNIKVQASALNRYLKLYFIITVCIVKGPRGSLLTSQILYSTAGGRLPHLPIGNARPLCTAGAFLILSLNTKAPTGLRAPLPFPSHPAPSPLAVLPLTSRSVPPPNQLRQLKLPA